LRISNVQHAAFFVLVALATLAFFGLIHEFTQPLFWAAILGVLFNRIQRGYLKLTRGRNSSAAALTLLTIVLIVILPLFFIAAAVAQEALGLYERISAGESELNEVFHYLRESLPEMTGRLERFGFDLQKVEERFSAMALTVSRFLGSQLLNVGQGTAEFLLKFFLMLYVLFFFLRDGEKLLAALGRALPFDEHREGMLFAKFAEVSRATMKGTLIVGAVQGTLGGIMFWILGVSAPVFWGVIMTVLSLLPALGSGIVWGPAGVILIVGGEVVRGIIMLAGGTLIIGLVDNVLRPLLVGRDTKMPDFLILLSTLGGLTIFGISGFVLGPMIAALFVTIWDMFAREYSEGIRG